MAKDKAAAKCAVHSIVNNLHSAKDTMFGGAQLKHHISRIKEMTGMSEQSLIMKMLWFAYENDEQYAQYRQPLAQEWLEKNRNK